MVSPIPVLCPVKPVHNPLFTVHDELKPVFAP